LLVAHPIFARDDRKELLRAARFLADKVIALSPTP
jgi:hypothetical protein